MAHVNHVPDDVAFVILKKLCFKSRKRFSTVKRSWCEFMGTFEFMKLCIQHTRKIFMKKFEAEDDERGNPLLLSNGSTTLLFIEDETELALRFPPRFSPFYSHIRILGKPENGTFCLYDFNGDDSTFPFRLLRHVLRHGLLGEEVEDFGLVQLFGQAHFEEEEEDIDDDVMGIADGNHKGAFLWNPTTNLLKPIPYPSLLDQKFMGVPHSVHFHGFGSFPLYMEEEETTKIDYRILQHLKAIPNNVMAQDLGLPRDVEYEEHEAHFHRSRWQIFSSIGFWRDLDIDMPPRFQKFDSELFFKGACHWWGKYDDDNDDDNAPRLVSFDMLTYQFITTPSPWNVINHNVHVALLNGAVTIITNPKATAYFQVFLLGEPGIQESWVSLYAVQIGPLPSIGSPIGTGKNGVVYFRASNQTGIASYDLKTEIFEEHHIEQGSHYSQVVLYDDLSDLYI